MAASKTNPPLNAVAVTPSDSTDITKGDGDTVETRGLFVGTGGDISVEMAGDQGGDQTVVFKHVQSGTLLPIGVTRVNSTLTTATNIVAMW